MYLRLYNSFPTFLHLFKFREQYFERMDFMKRWKAIILFIIGAASFGFNPIFVKLRFAEGYTLAEVNVIQMMIVDLFLWGIALFKMHHVKRKKT
jgi:hypothetical protein